MGALRDVAFAALLVGLNGCRCNSVDERELPVAPAAPAPATSKAATPLTSDECGPDIGGLGAISAAPVVLLGELPGLASAPAFAGDLACRLAFTNLAHRVTLALEMPTDERFRLDAYLASEGRDADRKALTSGPFWNGYRDGRSSIARLELIERVRQLNRRNANIGLRAIDAGTSREAATAKNVIALVDEKRGPVLVLIQSLRARTKPFEQKWMGEYVHDAVPSALSLENRYMAGSAWICDHDCGRVDVKALDVETDNKWRIDLLPAPDDKGFNGYWRIGAARASEPAVPF